MDINANIFRQADIFESEAVRQNEIRYSKKESDAGIKLTIFMLFAIGFSIYILIRRSKESGSAIIIGSLAILFLVFIIRSMVIGTRQKKKIFAGEFLVRRIVVVARADTSVGMDNYKVTVRCENSNTVDILVDSSLKKQMLPGMVGLLVLINGEKKTLFNNQYRFIPNNEIVPERNLGLFDFTRPLDHVHSEVISYYSGIFKKTLIKLILCSLGLIFGSVLLFFFRSFTKPISPFIALIGFVLIVLSNVTISQKASRDYYIGKKNITWIWALGMISIIFGLPFIAGLITSLLIVKIIALIAVVSITTFSYVYIFKDDLLIYRYVSSREYEVMSGRVVSRDYEVKYTLHHSTRIYTIIVESSSGTSYKFDDIDRKKYNSCVEGDTLIVARITLKEGKDKTPDYKMFIVPKA